MNLIDSATIETLNQLARHSRAFDSTIVFISENHLLKGGVLVCLLWWGWFRDNPGQATARLHLLATLIACFPAMILAKTLAWALPFRARPLHAENLDFTLPFTMERGILEGWSSFPSDHAVLFFALSAGLFYISKRIGLFAVLYTFIIICLPRVYLGLHYPSDLIAGAMIGVATTWICNRAVVTERIARPLADFSDSNPGIFYAGLFLLSYQIADMFISGRAVAGFALELLTGPGAG
jgi:undecaprenyl-diphosphatase